MSSWSFSVSAGRRESAAPAVDALVVREHAASLDLGEDLSILDLRHREHDAAVVQQ
jgi:hypothetical protein